MIEEFANVCWLEHKDTNEYTSRLPMLVFAEATSANSTWSTSSFSVSLTDCQLLHHDTLLWDTHLRVHGHTTGIGCCLRWKSSQGDCWDENDLPGLVIPQDDFGRMSLYTFLASIYSMAFSGQVSNSGEYILLLLWSLYQHSTCFSRVMYLKVMCCDGKARFGDSSAFETQIRLSLGVCPCASDFTSETQLLQL